MSRLAATLHARILNGHSSTHERITNGDEIKQEDELTTKSSCTAFGGLPEVESPVVEIKTEPGILKRSSPIHAHHSPEKKPHLESTLSPDIVPNLNDDGQCYLKFIRI